MAYLMALQGVVCVDEAMAIPAVRHYLEQLLSDEVIPTLPEIPGYPRADYAQTVLARCANTGVRDQIARLCLDGTSKFPTFLIPTVQIAGDRCENLGRCVRPSCCGAWLHRAIWGY